MFDSAAAVENNITAQLKTTILEEKGPNLKNEIYLLGQMQTQQATTLKIINSEAIVGEIARLSPNAI